jgi:putative hydrolase
MVPGWHAAPRLRKGTRGGIDRLSAYAAGVSDEGQSGQPFGGIPFLGDLARMLQSQGSIQWEAARQLAYANATEGQAEPNVDPAVRFRLEELARVAELHVQATTGLETAVGARRLEVVPVNRTAFTSHTLDAYRPLFETLATSLGHAPTITPATEALAEADDDDAGLAMLGQLLGLVAPTMLGMAIGSMVGRLARRSFGQYDLPLPRPASGEVLILPATIETFADDWSLPDDELLLWVCLHQITSHAVLGVPSVRSELERLLREHAAGFRPDPSAVTERLGSLDPSGGDALGELQQVFGDPELLLGAVRSPEQERLRPRLDALVAVIVGYIDHAVDHTAQQVMGSGGRIAEAVRRRRLETGSDDVFLERLLGLSLTRAQVDRGVTFVEGVIEREGEAGLGRLWTSVRALPTPAEVDAPGLWLARLEVDDPDAEPPS